MTDLREMLQNSVRQYGKRDAFRLKTPDGGVRGISYEQLQKDVNALGTALLHIGLKGKHIAVIGENSYEWVVAYLTTINGVGVAVPIDKELPAEDIADILNRSDASAIIFSSRYRTAVCGLLPGTPEVGIGIDMHAENDGDGVLSLPRLLEVGMQLMAQGDNSYLLAPIDPKRLSVLMYTSGTTGKSKGVMLCHDNFTSVLYGTMRAIKGEPVTMSALPIHHSAENTGSILFAISTGVTVCFCDSLKYFTDNLNLFKPYMMGLVPLILENMYKTIWGKAKSEGKAKLLKRLVRVSNLLLKLHIDVRRLLFKKVRDAFGGNLRLIICGAAPLRKELVTGFNELGIQILNGYGTTECAPVVTVNRNRFYKPDSVGITIPCCKIRIDSPDENGDGEILVNGENVMLGYYKDEEGTANAFTDGWFRTGDIGRIDDEGFVYITGRLKNIIILSNGKNVQPEELEDLLTTKLPYIKEVLVYACAPAKGMDPVITAAVFFDKDYVQNNGIQDPESLLSADVAEINRRLPTYKQIGQVQVRPEEFQKTTTRKIKRHSVG